MSSRASSGNFLKVVDPGADLYQMLELSPLASPKEIESAIDEALLWWGKLYLDPEYRERALVAFERLERAREVLLDPIARSRYDRQRQLAQEYWSQLRWQPVRELMEILVRDGSCGVEEYRLLKSFARKRKLSTGEFEALLFAEASSQGIRLPLSAKIDSESKNRFERPFFRISLILFLVSILLLILLPVLDWGLFQSAFLLSIPVANNLRLLIQNPSDRGEVVSSLKSPVNWFIGLTVLGTPTVVAFLDFYSHHLFTWGALAIGTIWFNWLWLVIGHYLFSRPSEEV